MKLKYWIIIILVVVAGCATAFYYIKQPAPDSGPVAVHHQIKSLNVTSTQPSIPSQQVSGSKIYMNSQYNFSFQYPNNWTVSSGDGDYTTPIQEQNSLHVDANSEEAGSGGITILINKINLNDLNGITAKKFNQEIGNINWTVYNLHSSDKEVPYSKAFSTSNQGTSYYLVAPTDSSYSNSVFDNLLNTFKFTN